VTATADSPPDCPYLIADDRFAYCALAESSLRDAMSRIADLELSMTQAMMRVARLQRLARRLYRGGVDVAKLPAAERAEMTAALEEGRPAGARRRR
jgi:hypothetical protein